MLPYFGTSDLSLKIEMFVSYSSSVVMALAYGKVPQSYNDREVQAVNRCLTRLGVNLRPGLWRVDVYPFLRCVSRNVQACLQT
jgi:hypothetical protein